MQRATGNATGLSIAEQALHVQCAKCNLMNDVHFCVLISNSLPLSLQTTNYFPGENFPFSAAIWSARKVCYFARVPCMLDFFSHFPVSICAVRVANVKISMLSKGCAAHHNEQMQLFDGRSSYVSRRKNFQQ